MSRNIVRAEMHNGPTRIRVQTYHYEKPSEKVGTPSNHTLTLMMSSSRTTSPPRRWLGQFQAGQQSRLTELGGLIFVPAGHALLGHGPGGPQDMVACSFAPGQIDALADFETSWDRRELARCYDLRSGRITDTMRRLGQEVTTPGFGSDILVDALTSVLPIELARLFHTMRGDEPLARGGLTPRQLRTIEDYVRDWPVGGVKVTDLATLTGLSRAHFMRAFKQSMGETVHSFVEQIRLEQTQALLAGTALPLKQIAARMGFANPASFSIAFRRLTGTSPGNYRKMLKN